MDKINADIDTLEVAFTSATRIHSDHCLLAAEGGEAEAKARDKAHTKFLKVERALADARAAHTAAERRKAVDAEKDKAKELAERQKRVAALQKKVAATCKTLGRFTGPGGGGSNHPARRNDGFKVGRCQGRADAHCKLEPRPWLPSAPFEH